MTKTQADLPILPDWGRVRLALSGLVLAIWGHLALQFSQQINASDLLWDDPTTPPVESAIHAPMWLAMLACLALFVYFVHAEHSPRWLGLVVRWQGLRTDFRALVFVLLALPLFTLRMLQVSQAPLPLSPYRFDDQIYIGDKYAQLVGHIASLEKGCFLCVYRDDDVIAIETFSGGDDIGAHVLYAAFIRLTGAAPSIEHYVRFVVGTTVFVLIALSLSLTAMTGQLWAGFIFFGVVILFDGLFIYMPFFLTYHWSSAVVSWIAAVFLVDLIFVTPGRRFLDQRIFMLIFLVYGAAAFMLFSVRSSNGAVQWVFISIVLLLSAIQRRQVLRPVLAMSSFAIAFFAMSMLLSAALAWRNEAYGLDTQGIVSHPFSHALYIGLGVVKNDYGIYWNDGVGAIPCPVLTLSGYTHEYYDCIRRVFIDLALSDPNLVLRSLLMKFETLLQNSLRFSPLVVTVPLALLIIRSWRFWLAFGLLLILQSLPALLVMSFHLYMLGFLSSLTALLALSLLKLPDYLYARN